MEILGDTANPNYRLFLSAEPAATSSAHIIPQVKTFLLLMKYDIDLIIHVQLKNS